MKIREIGIEDLPQIFEVRIATWHNPNGAEELKAAGITPDLVGAAIMAGESKGWLCELDGQVVGFAIGIRATGEMWVIAVLNSHEGRGIGRALLEEVENWLAACGWSQIWLTTDVDESFRAVGFYRHLEWTDWKFESGDRYMRKQIEQKEAPDSSSC